MSESSHTAARTVSLEQLTALNDEIAALARAGVPLDTGLLHLGSDMPGRLGRIARSLGQRLERGEDLLHVLEHDPQLPPAYRAVVAAGIRSGRLPVALEGMSALLRRASESRWLLLSSLAYPVFVLLLAYLLYVFSAVQLSGPIIGAYRDIVGGGIELLNADLGRAMGYLAPVVFGTFLVLFVIWWIRSRSASALSTESWRSRSWTRRPSVRKMLSAGRLATFSDVLALLLEQHVAMDEAVVLAAEASGDRALLQSSKSWAERLRRGQPAIDRGTDIQAPPVLAWLLQAGADRPTLVRALRRTAESYRRQAAWIARWLSIYLPMWLTVAIGGTATALYAVAVIAPWCHMLYVLARP